MVCNSSNELYTSLPGILSKLAKRPENNIKGIRMTGVAANAIGNDENRHANKIPNAYIIKDL